jgi:hypothetical protein
VLAQGVLTLVAWLVRFPSPSLSPCLCCRFRLRYRAGVSTKEEEVAGEATVLVRQPVSDTGQGGRRATSDVVEELYILGSPPEPSRRF